MSARTGRRNSPVVTVSGDFGLTMDELREVTRFVAESAEQVHASFAAAYPDDPRPRAAIDAAWLFANGANRSKLQRVAAMDAHRAAASATGEVPRLAARAAGDAASAAYLHPIAKAHQVGHILRAAACAARITELAAEGHPDAGYEAIADARRRATPLLIDVLRRYPPVPPGKSRVERLMVTLDAALREPG